MAAMEGDEKGVQDGEWQNFPSFLEKYPVYFSA
jgi:hypothetical protein